MPYKALATMTQLELSQVRKYYSLNLKNADLRSSRGWDSRIQRDLERNYSRMDTVSFQMVRDVLQDLFETFYAQKVALSLLLGSFSILFTSNLWIVLLPTPISLMISILAILLVLLGQICLTLGIKAQQSLEAEFAHKPQIRHDAVYYDTDCKTNPGKKIFDSLNYKESTFLMFHKFNITERQNNRIHLQDREGDVIKTWDLHGNLVP